jgi:hypothetical protein
MNLSWLPGKRYLLRELVPRAVLLTVTFKYLMPLVPFSLFQFHGDLAVAAALGFSFTVFFCILGAYVGGSAVVAKFMEANKNAWWFGPGNIAFALFVPAPFLALAAHLAFGAFVIHGLVGLLVGSVIMNIACALTHDYGAK